MPDISNKRAVSLQTKFYSGVLLFCVLYGFALYLILASALDMRRLADSSQRISGLTGEIATQRVLLERLEAQVDDYLVADYPEKKTAILNTLDKIVLSSMGIASRVGALNVQDIGAAMDGEKLQQSLIALLNIDLSSGQVNERAAVAYAGIKSLVASNETLSDRIYGLSEKVSTEYEKVFRIFAVEAASIGIGMLVALIGLSLFFYLSFLVPIRELRVTANDIRLGNFGKKSGITSHDEIGQLAKIMDDASDSLRKKAVAEQRLKDLEKQLIARAALLEKKIRELETINVAAIDREMKMIELKKRIIQLESGSDR